MSHYGSLEFSVSSNLGLWASRRNKQLSLAETGVNSVAHKPQRKRLQVPLILDEQLVAVLLRSASTFDFKGF